MVVRWLMVCIVMVMAIWFWMRPDKTAPTTRPIKSQNANAKIEKPTADQTPKRVSKTSLVAPMAPLDASVAVDTVADSTVPDVDSTVMPKGPFAIDLGTHTIHLKDPKEGRKVRVRLTAMSRTEAGRVQVVRRKSRLVRMMFFLLSKRNPQAVERDDARSRLETDLFNRFVQVVPGSALTDLKIDEYEVLRSPKKNAEEP